MQLNPSFPAVILFFITGSYPLKLTLRRYSHASHRARQSAPKGHALRPQVYQLDNLWWGNDGGKCSRCVGGKGRCGARLYWQGVARQHWAGQSDVRPYKTKVMCNSMRVKCGVPLSGEGVLWPCYGKVLGATVIQRCDTTETETLPNRIIEYI